MTTSLPLFYTKAIIVSAIFRKLSPDSIGLVAGTLCLIHCIATPFLFLAKACSTACCSDSPWWWQSLDYVFLVVSFGAIFHATKNTSKTWMKTSLWISWFILLLVLLTQTISKGVLPEMLVHGPALSIIGLHFYNRKYCQCKDDAC